MKFKFVYENLLKHKKIEKDVANRNMISARDNLENEQGHLKNMHHLIDQSRSFNNQKVSREKIEKIDLEILKWTDLFMEGQKIKIERQNKTVHNLNQVFEDYRELLMNAAKDFKVFERLREKMEERHKKAVKKDEMKRIDELVVMYSKRGNIHG